MRVFPVKLEVREAVDGWRLFALPCHNIGWAPIAMTPPRGTPGGALEEFASALYRLTHEQPQTSVAEIPMSGSGNAIGCAHNSSSSSCLSSRLDGSHP
jgi:hypothetical protein